MLALWAARDAGVKRVVMTSSFAANGYDHPPAGRPFTADTRTEPAGQGDCVKSKTLAERAAWDFMAARWRAGACSHQPDRRFRSGARA